MVTKTEIRDYIIQAAKTRGINPTTALKVYRGEGAIASLSDGMQSFVKKNGVRETSYGPYQLKIGGGLGDKFIKKTGLDLKDIKTYKQQVDFALDYAAKNGWTSWYGAKANGVAKWDGLATAKATGITANDSTQVAGAGNVPMPRLRPGDTAIASDSTGSAKDSSKATAAIFNFLGKQDPTQVSNALAFTGYSKPQMSPAQEEIARAGISDIARRMGIDYAAKVAPDLYSAVATRIDANGKYIERGPKSGTIASDATGFPGVAKVFDSLNSTPAAATTTATKSVPTTNLVKTSDVNIQHPFDNSQAPTFAKMGGENTDLQTLARAMLQGTVDYAGPESGKEPSTAGTLVPSQRANQMLLAAAPLSLSLPGVPALSSESFVKPAVVATPAIPSASGVTQTSSDALTRIKELIASPAITPAEAAPKLTLSQGVVPMPTLRPAQIAAPIPANPNLTLMKELGPQINQPLPTAAVPVVTPATNVIATPARAAQPKATQAATAATPAEKKQATDPVSSFFSGLGSLFSGIGNTVNGTAIGKALFGGQSVD
jgi:hypothetical protein